MLLAGLLTMAVADGLGVSARTVGLSLLSVAVTYRQPDALLAAASVSILILYGVATVASADKLAGAGSVVAVMTVIFIAGRARRAGVESHGRG